MNVVNAVAPPLSPNVGTGAEVKPYIMECTLAVERTETLGEATTESRAELHGFLSAEVLESALDIMRKVVDW